MFCKKHQAFFIHAIDENYFKISNIHQQRGIKKKLQP